MLKTLAKESLIYGVSGILTRFVSVLLMPIYTAIFAPADFGIVSLVTTFSALLSILLILSLDNSMGRWYYENESEDDRKITSSTFLWSCFTAALLLSTLVFVLRGYIADTIFRTPETRPLLALMAINLPLTVFSVFTVNMLRLQRKPIATTVFTLSTALLTVALNIVFIVVLKVGISGIFYAQIITSIVATIWTIVLFRNALSPFAFSTQRWSEMINFSLPLIPATVAHWVIALSGAYFIQIMWGTHEVGLYQVGLNVASIAALATTAFQMAWAPFAYSIHKQAGARQVYARVLLAFVASSCSLSLGVMLFAPEILRVLTSPSYYDAATVAGLLAFGQVLLGMSSIAAIGPGIVKNNKPYGAAVLVSAGLLVVLNLALVPRLGKEGAAISVLLSQSVVPLIVFARGQKIYPIPYRFAATIFVLGTSIGVGLGGMRLIQYLEPTFVLGVLIKISFLLSYCVILFLLLRKEISPSRLIAAVDR